MKKRNQHIRSFSQIIFTTLVTFLILGGSYFLLVKMSFNDKNICLTINVKVDNSQNITLYYTDEKSFSDEKTISQKAELSSDFQELTFTLPPLTKLKKLRLDFGANAENIRIKNVSINGSGEHYLYEKKALLTAIQPINDIDKLMLKNSLVTFKVTGADPYLYFTFNVEKIYKDLNQPEYNLLAFTPEVEIAININTEKTRKVKLFYAIDGNFDEEHCLTEMAYSDQGFHEVKMILPPLDSLKEIRLDPTNGNHKVDIKSITFSNWIGEYTFNATDLAAILNPANDIGSTKLADSILSIQPNGDDPYVYFDTNINLVYQKLTQIPFKLIPFLFALILSMLIGIWMFNLNSTFFNINTNNNLVNIFFLIITLPLLTMLFGKKSTTTTTLENRNKATLPKLETTDLFNYPEKYTAYFNDNVGLRDEVLLVNSLIKSKLLGISPIPRKVTLGKKDWLFLSEDTDPKYNKASHLFTNKELKTIQENLEQRANYLKQKGCKFYFLIAPSKSTIYPEYLANNLQNRTPSRLNQLFTYLNKHSSVNIIDVRDRLIKAKKTTTVYYKGDSHWNAKGAYLTYDQLLNTVQKDFPTTSPFSEDYFGFVPLMTNDGDLAKFILLQDYWDITKANTKFPGGRKAKKITQGAEINAENKKRPVITLIKDTSQPKLLMFRDSYAIALIPMISEHFSKSTYIWNFQMTPEIIHQEQPNLVILQMYERSLEELLHPLPKAFKQP